MTPAAIILMHSVSGVLDACGNSYVNAYTENWLRWAHNLGAYDGPFTGNIIDVKRLWDGYLQLNGLPDIPPLPTTDDKEKANVPHGTFPRCPSRPETSDGLHQWQPGEQKEKIDWTETALETVRVILLAVHERSGITLSADQLNSLARLVNLERYDELRRFLEARHASQPTV